MCVCVYKIIEVSHILTLSLYFLFWFPSLFCLQNKLSSLSCAGSSVFQCKVYPRKWWFSWAEYWQTLCFCHPHKANKQTNKNLAILKGKKTAATSPIPSTPMYIRFTIVTVYLLLRDVCVQLGPRIISIVSCFVCFISNTEALSTKTWCLIKPPVTS